MIKLTNSQSRSRQTVKICQKCHILTDFSILFETFETGRWCCDKIKISRSWSRLLDRQDKLFEIVEIFSTVETYSLPVSRSRVWIETWSRQIETPRLNFHKYLDQDFSSRPFLFSFCASKWAKSAGNSKSLIKNWEILISLDNFNKNLDAAKSQFKSLDFNNLNCEKIKTGLDSKDNLDKFQKLVSPLRTLSILISIGLDCWDPQAYKNKSVKNKLGGLASWDQLRSRSRCLDMSRCPFSSCQDRDLNQNQDFRVIKTVET